MNVLNDLNQLVGLTISAVKTSVVDDKIMIAAGDRVIILLANSYGGNHDFIEVGDVTELDDEDLADLGLKRELPDVIE